MVAVVVVDRSSRSVHVVSEAASLAAAFDEVVHVVHALTRSKFIDLGLMSAQAKEPKDMDEIRSAATEVAEDSASGLDAPYETVGLAGNPADEVIEYVDGQDVSYTMVSSRRRSRTGEMLSGGVAQSILLNASYLVVSTLVDKE